MTDSKSSSHVHSLDSRRSKPKWHLVYYLIAFFDVLTVATSLYLNHHLMDSYERSVRVNQVWNGRLQSYSELSQRAAAVNAPGNDIFDSHNVKQETARLNAALHSFGMQMVTVQQDVQTRVEPEHRESLMKTLDQVDLTMGEMRKEANLIFSYFSRNQSQKAAQRMASMDQAFARVNVSLEKLRQQVAQIQQQNLEQQKQQASLLKVYEYAIAGGVLIMVTSLTLYGYKLSKQMAADLQTKEQLITELHQTQIQMVQSEKMAALGQMIAGVAHEINNPLNFISSNITHLDEYTQDLLKLLHSYQQHYSNPPQSLQVELEEADLDFLIADVSKLLQSMQVGSDRIHEIVKSLRNFSRLDEAECKPVDIHEGIDNTLMIVQHRLKPTANRPEIVIIKEYGQLPLVECYAGPLNQVFMNLLVNAIDALEEANQEYSYEEIVANPNTIWIHTVERDTDWIVISISDNGSGMSEAVRAKLFDPFFTTKPVGKGTGLGLAISYQIVTEKHNGKIRCDSTSGEGTKFVIEIPTRLSAG